MGKNKQRNRKPDEQLLGENRLQRKQIKKLQQEIRRLQKELGYNQNRTPVDPKIMDEEPQEAIPNCPECARGYIQEVEFAGRTFIICPVCNFRKKL